MEKFNQDVDEDNLEAFKRRIEEEDLPIEIIGQTVSFDFFSFMISLILMKPFHIEIHTKESV